MATTKITTNSLADSAVTTAKLADLSVTSAKLASSISIGTLTVTNGLTLSGQLINSLGTALLPSYSFTGDPNTGMYSTGADILGFATGGVLRWSISAGGNLISNGGLISLANGDSTNPAIYFAGSSNTGIYRIGGSNNWNVATGGINALSIDSSQRVGIGTTTPSAKLHAISTTEQLRIGYDASNYLSATVSIAGLVTLTATGASAGVVLASPVTATAQPVLSALSDTSVITKSLFDKLLMDPSIFYYRDDFVGGAQSGTGTIGELGWTNYSVGGGTMTTGPIASPSANPGQRVMNTGTTSGNSHSLYWANERIYPLAATAWEMIWVFKVNQLTDCDVIVGGTNAAGIGNGTFGGKSFGARYSSATDTNFMFYAKNTDLTFAANDANNFAISSGIVADTAFHTVRMRSTTLGVVEMKIDAGAWITVTLTSITGLSLIPFMYVATRTNSAKSANIDFFSYYKTGHSR